MCKRFIVVNLLLGEKSPLKIKLIVNPDKSRVQYNKPCPLYKGIDT